jgi:hypothetical protein
LFRGNRAITVAVACRELNNLSHFSQFLLIIIELHSSNTVTNRLQTRQQNFPLNSPPDLRFFSLYFQFLARPTKTTGPSIVQAKQSQLQFVSKHSIRRHRALLFYPYRRFLRHHSRSRQWRARR